MGLLSASCPSLAFLAASLLIAAIGRSSSISAAANANSVPKYNALFSFGDSMEETGNICISSNSTELNALTCTHPPYGMTYFGRPSCRWCNGRVVVDFIAQALGLPLLPPSKSKGKDFHHGANMAITGGTAMNFSFYNSLGIDNPVWNHGSVDMQIQWFEELMPSLCGTRQNCRGFLEKSLFQFGGFGGNDYNILLLELGLTTEQAMNNNTLLIVNAIVKGVERLIALGAVHIVVPGLLPTGCLPLFLALLASSSSETDFDQYGCLKSYNQLTEYHNSMLRKQTQILQGKYRSTRIMYADYYSQVYQMVQQPQKFGFSNPIEACCGAGGGKFNFDITARCGMPGATACHDPSAHLSWDGVHPTEAANKMIADAWLNGPYCTPPILS